MFDLEDAERRSPLTNMKSEAETITISARRAGVVARELDHLGLLVLRGDPSDAGFVDHAAQILGCSLPQEPSVFHTIDDRRVLWISPDEWWVLCPVGEKQALQQELAEALQQSSTQILDNTGSLTALKISGTKHLTVLRHLTPYDIESMTIGACISTAIPQTSITILRPDSAHTILLFRRSFALWVWQLIRKSARPYGLYLPSQE